MLASLNRPWNRRAAVALSVAAAALGTHLTPSGSADLQGQLNGAKSAAGELKSQIDADSAQISRTNDGIQNARTRLTHLQDTLDQRVTQLRHVQSSLLSARDHLVELENRLQAATSALSANLVASYEGTKPDLVSVVLNSHGFGQLLDQVGFLQRVGHQDANIVSTTRTARAEVATQAKRLESLERRDRTLANQVLTQRNQVAALQSALARRRIEEINARARVSGRYADARARVATLQKKLNEQERKAAEAAARAAQTGNADVSGIAVNTGGMVQAPAGAPEAIHQIMAAGNAIATLPYIWGGGHGSFHADGYDCSGSVSYALAAAGLLSAPMTSGSFESWGDPGPGKWVTIYANADHVWMEVAGWRFDTVALAETGTRWTRGGGEFSGMVVRHPPGL